MKKLYSERNGGTKPRIAEQLDRRTRDALLNLVASRIDEGWFTFSFPGNYQDTDTVAGTNIRKLRIAMEGHELIWPAEIYSYTATGEASSDTIPDGQIFDLLEFAYEVIAEPEHESHYTGRKRFSDDVNRLLERNGIAFDFRLGEIARTGPAVLQDALALTLFKTGDDDLDRLLETARAKFTHRSLDVRRESLEALWDAWERLKTVEARDKKASIKALLDKAADSPALRERLETEALALSDIGNRFMIRHSETDRTQISESVHVDYLFHRMFSMIRLLLKASNRGG